MRKERNNPNMPVGLQLYVGISELGLCIILAIVGYRIWVAVTHSSVLWSQFVLENAALIVTIPIIVLSILCITRKIRALYPVLVANAAWSVLHGIYANAQIFLKTPSVTTTLILLSMMVFNVNILIYILQRADYCRGLPWKQDLQAIHKQEVRFLWIAGISFAIAWLAGFSEFLVHYYQLKK